MGILKNRGKQFWIVSTLVALLVFYPLTFGPMCWMASRCDGNELPVLYLPLGWIMEKSPATINQIIQAYARLGMPPDRAVGVPIGVKLSRVIWTEGPSQLPPMTAPSAPAPIR